MVNYYNSKEVERNFNSNFEGNIKDGFMSTFTSLFENFKCMALIMFMMLTTGQLSWAQSTANYAFTTNATSSLALDASGNAVDMSSGTTQLVGPGLDAAASAVTNIGFNFVFMGSNFTQYSVNEDGQLKLGSIVVGTNSYGLTGGTATAPLLSASNADFRTGTTTGKIHYKLVGTAPNRTLVVEFKNIQVFYTSPAAAGNSTWQIRLYETSGIIEYVYGTVNATDVSTTAANRAPTIGFYTGAANNLFASVLYATQTVSTTTPYTVNPIVGATGDLTGLSSAADGSRRMFRFTPPNSTPADPTTLTFTAVGASTITPNWVDNSTDESLFIVTRATDPAFTLNVVTTNVNSTSRLTTGTPYSVAQNGLTPSTLYYFKIQSATEASLPSTGITGSQATTPPLTYYWVGTTGGNWNTPANWNTAADNTGTARTIVSTSDILVVDGDGTIPGGSTTINVDLASFTIGQLTVNSNTNLTLQSSSTTTRTITVSGWTGDDFVIEAGSTLNLTHAANAVAIAFSGTGNTGLLAGTLNIGGGSGNTFNSTGGTSTLVTVAATGIINNSFAGNTGVTGSVASLSFLDGSAFNVSGQTTGAPNVPLATWATNSTLTISGLTTSTNAPTNNNQSFGNITYNCPASNATWNMFGAVTTSIVKGNLTIVATGTGQFRTVSTGTLTINGNVIINSGASLSGHTTGTTIVNGNTTINSGGTLKLDTAGIYRQQGSILTNNGTIVGTGSATVNSLVFVSFTDIPITFTGSGTVTPAINTISVQTLGGLTISHTNQIPVLRANLFYGNVTGSNKLTFGTGAALASAVQVGSAGNLNPAGILLSQPTWNLGTGTLSLIYQQGSLPYTTSFEVPPSRTVNNITLSNTNGLTLAGGPLEVSGTLTLTAGNFTTSTANLLSLGTAAAAGTLAGGSTASYINGPFARTIASANANTNYILFPVGKAAYAPISLAPATTAISVMKAEAFDSNSGTANPSITSLAANRRWEAPLVSGTITNINVRLGDAALIATNIPVQAPTAAGEYTSSFGSTATFAAGTPNTIQSNTAALSAGYTGFLSYAVSNACVGTPTPGATTATSTTLCFGGSTTLGITSNPAGSGVTYQWQSSTDGVSYSDVVGAIASTYVASPTVITYYQCIVTCSAVPSSGTSTPIQITFTNNVTGTTPATRCGTGTVTLGATPNSGATINWYANASGGTSLASGTSFVTPSITTTTTYFAESSTPTSGNATIGTATTLTGATTQPTAFCNRWPNYWSQTIYTAAELTAAGLLPGNITDMSYNISTLGDGATNANFTVKIGTVAGTSFGTNAFLSTTAFTTVYGPSTYTHTASGLQTITFTTPFVWDGVSNIVVNVTHDGADSINNSQTYYTATTDNKVLWVNSYTGSTTTGTTSLNRLNIVFAGQVPCASPRVAVNATVTSAPTFTLSTASTSICAGETSSVVTITAGSADYDTYVWSPLTGVSGNAITGWTFNPAASTSYTLTVSQSGGALCSLSATVNVTVNPKPSAITITPSTASTCVNSIQSLVATGGTVGSSGSTPIGTATTLTTDNGIEPTAFNNRYEHYWMQMVFTAAELNAAGIQAGNISGVKFNITTIGSAPNVSDFRVFMGNTALSTLTGFISAGLSEVYATPTYTQAIGVNSIVFNTPYVWDGTSNIIVDIRSTGIDSSLNSSTYYTATADNKTVSAVTSTTFPNSNAYVASNPAGTLSLKRLNTTFDWNSSVPTTLTWSPVTDLYTDAAATVAYVGGTNASTVYVKSATAATTTYTATANVTATGCQETATVDVTVNPNTNNVTTTSACGGYHWAVNNTDYTSSGTYTYVTGCHTETLNLTINVTPTADNPSDVSVCGSYVLPALTVGNYFTGSNGSGTALFAGDVIGSTATIYVYAQTGTVPNCTDENSFIVTITPNTNNVTTASACGGYHWAVNNTDYTSSGTYTYVTGCHTETLNLTINVTPTADNPSDVSVCGSYVLPALTVGNYFTGSNGSGTALFAGDVIGSTATIYVYAQTGTVPNCTDENSFIVTITPNTNNVTTASACGGYHWAVNNTDYTSSGTYTYVTGCHTETLNLTIDTATTPTGATTQVINGGVASDATIEDIVVSGTGIIWYPTALDAANNTNAIPAGTQLVDGEDYFAVSVNGTCTSSALQVTVTVVLGHASFDLSQLNYYPNPVKDIFNVKYSKEITSVDVYDLTGRKVIEMKPNTLEVQLNMTSLSNAMYIVRLQSVDGITELKVYKN